MLLSESSFLQLELLPLSNKLNSSQKHDLQKLLEQFTTVFESPTKLLPKRGHDHQIPLKNEAQVVRLNLIDTLPFRKMK